jgi:hypothetical protein
MADSNCSEDDIVARPKAIQISSSSRYFIAFIRHLTQSRLFTPSNQPNWVVATKKAPVAETGAFFTFLI